MMRALWHWFSRPTTKAAAAPAVVVAAPATPVAVQNPPWVDLALHAEREELPATQKAAAAWLTGLTTFSGLVAVAGVSVGTDALEDRALFGFESTYWVGVALIIGVLFTSSRATLLAVRANAVSWDLGSTDEDKLRAMWYTSIDSIRWYLTESRRWTKATVWFLMGYALLVLLSTKVQDPPNAYARVITADGVYCGLLVSKNGKLSLHSRSGPPGGPQVTAEAGTVLPGTVTGITPVASCPANAVPPMK